MAAHTYSDEEENENSGGDRVPELSEPKANTGFLFKVSKSYDNLASENETDDILQLKAGDIVVLLSARAEDGMWYGEKISKTDRKKGKFPPSNVSQLVTSNPDVSSFEIPYSSLSFDRSGNFLGRGGFGQVYSGYWGSEKVAIKIPSPTFSQNSDDSSLVKKLKKEAFIQHNLHHENIVKLLKISLDNPIERCLVLEFCAGGSLSPVVYHRAVAPRILIEWALQITRGMQYLHYQAPIPILHKDLKSGNILFSQEITADDTFENKTLKITDFGLAKPIEYQSQSQLNCQGGGTVEWMAPEVIKRSLYSHASDSWSFGVVFWELLIGQTPYKNLPYHTVLYKIGEHNLTLPIPGQLEPSFASLMRGCWEISVSSRFTFNRIESELLSILQKFDEWPPISAEEFTQMRELQWYVDINYDYITNTDFGGKEMVTQQLVEELIRAHKEKRDAQLRLAERELKEALSAQNLARESTRKSKTKKNSHLNPSDIGFPSNPQHVLSITDHTAPRGYMNSSELLSQDSIASYQSSMYSPPRLGNIYSGPYSTWTQPRSNRKFMSKNKLDHDSTENVDQFAETTSPVDFSTMSCEISTKNKHNIRPDKFSRSESNILSIVSSNSSTSAKSSNESQMSASDSLETQKHQSLVYKLLKPFTNKIHFNQSKKGDRKASSPRVDKGKDKIVKRGPTESFYKKQQWSPAQHYPEIVDTVDRTPIKLIKISDQGTGGPSRPTNLELTYSSRSGLHYANHNLSSHSDEGDSESFLLSGSSRMFSSSRPHIGTDLFSPRQGTLPCHTHNLTSPAMSSRSRTAAPFSGGHPMSPGLSRPLATTPNNNSSFLLRSGMNLGSSSSNSPQLCHRFNYSPNIGIRDASNTPPQKFFRPSPNLHNQQQNEHDSHSSLESGDEMDLDPSLQAGGGGSPHRCETLTDDGQNAPEATTETLRPETPDSDPPPRPDPPSMESLSSYNLMSSSSDSAPIIRA